MARKQKTSRWFVRLGLLALGYAAWREINRRVSNNPQVSGQGGGSRGWGLVTGASSGIGTEFARQLAARGYNLILVARREARLRAIAEELERDWGVTVRVLGADLSNEADTARVEKEISELPDLEILVNDAGFGATSPFIEGSIDEHLRMIDVHVIAVVGLTRAALPGMLARHSGTIINVSSLSAFVPGPTSVTYSPTKAYLNNFTEALFLENKGQGVKFQALCPGFTVTEFHDTLPDFPRSRLPVFLWMSAVEVVRQSLEALDGGPVIFVPGWANRMIAFSAQSLLLSPFVRLGASMVRLRS